MSEPTIGGIHHITAIAGEPQRNLDFYTGVLGLRLVKLTVNFDDPGTYHFYFGDRHGSPGSILTFFPWAGVPRGTPGNSQVTATSFAVPNASLEFWRARLSGHGAEDGGTRFGEPVLRCADPDGLPLELIGTAAASRNTAWTGAVDAPHAITGFHSATLAEQSYEKTAGLLQVMGMRPAGTEGNRFRYQMGAGTGAIVDIVCAPEGKRGRPGAGTVHHIAWRTPDDAQQLAWRKRLAEAGHDVTPVQDRSYFHSIYYHEPGGILFEIATDPPGFARDEDPDHLGERLMLPPQFERHRAAIERALPPLKLPLPKARA